MNVCMRLLRSRNGKFSGGVYQPALDILINTYERKHDQTRTIASKKKIIKKLRGKRKKKKKKKKKKNETKKAQRWFNKAQITTITQTTYCHAHILACRKLSARTSQCRKKKKKSKKQWQERKRKVKLKNIREKIVKRTGLWKAAGSWVRAHRGAKTACAIVAALPTALHH